MSAITTHVLDTSTGRPAAGVPVTLEKQAGGGWQSAGQGVTNQDGRITDLLGGAKLAPGTYRLTFDTAAYFRRQPGIVVLSAGAGDVHGQRRRTALPRPAVAEPVRILHLSGELSHGNQALGQ